MALYTAINTSGRISIVWTKLTIEGRSIRCWGNKNGVLEGQERMDPRQVRGWLPRLEYFYICTFLRTQTNLSCLYLPRFVRHIRSRSTYHLYPTRNYNHNGRRSTTRRVSRSQIQCWRRRYEECRLVAKYLEAQHLETAYRCHQSFEQGLRLCSSFQELGL